MGVQKLNSAMMPISRIQPKPLQDTSRFSGGSISLLGGLRAISSGIQGRIEEIDGQPVLVGYVHGRPYGVLLLIWERERVKQIYLVVNADKLHWLN
jgi:hypothetical protein